MENCVAPGLDEFDVLLEIVLSLVRVPSMLRAGYPTLLAWRWRYDLSRLKTSRVTASSPRMVTAWVFTHSHYSD